MLRFLFVIIALLFAGPAWSQDVLNGTWKSELGSATLTFESDGTYKLTSPGEFDYGGKYTLSGQSVTFEDAFGGQGCPGVQGIYNFSIVVNSIEFVPVDDFCAERRDHLRGSWANAGTL